MNYAIIIGIVFFVAIGFITVGVLIRYRRNRNINIRNASLTVEELEIYAKRMALDHTISSKRYNLGGPIKQMNDDYAYILNLYKDLNDDMNQKRAVPQAAEWLLDNFYVIEEQVKGTRQDFSRQEYDQLPVLKKGPLKGYTRVFAIATEFVALVDAQVEESSLRRYLEAYQSHSVLFDREIRMIPTMVRLALIGNMRITCERIKEIQNKWNMADEIVEKWMDEEDVDFDKITKLFKNSMEYINETNPSFVEHLFFRLRRSGRSYSNVLQYIDEHLDKFNTTTELIAQKEHNAQAVSTVSMGNCVMSLKYVASLDWIHLFEAVSYVERILQRDPKGVYGQMDVESRGYYLRRIEKFAKLYGVSELHIAREAVGLAEQAVLDNSEVASRTNDHIRKEHVGYYLAGKGVKDLENKQKGKMKYQSKILIWLKRRPVGIYMGSIGFITLAILFGAVIYAVSNAESSLALAILLTCLVMLVPASELAISIVNSIVGKIKKPAVFPRLELKEGIPAEQRTMVVVPVLLSNEGRVDELLGNIENHYLSNSEDNLFFALIGAFQDSEGPNTAADRPILRRAELGIMALNQRYAKEGEDIFYFYHRLSQFNETDNNWTGWERKRGALMEFNQMLLGSERTSFRHYSENIMPEGRIKYIITLDADTVLPLGMAKKMIGTMAHPLNLPIICPQKGIVVEGHGLMQPRISFDIESSNKSIFSRIFTGQEGIDPYASAISDVYQDLFGEGIFTGKGIYDLVVFHQVLKDAVPENAVLSHDLLEGSYVRAALVSDLELIDSYPTKYNSYMLRLHRWIRGDWQLIPWLGSSVYNKNKKRIANPLSIISIWKITDNLRRSLVAPSLMLLFFMGFSLLPGSAFMWVGFGAVVLSYPFLIHIFGKLSSVGAVGLKLHRVKRHIAGFFGLKATFFQLLIMIVFLPCQAAMILHAITVTLIRVLITKKNMLEWVTSDDAEKIQSNTLGSYYSTMGVSSLAGAPMALLAYYFKPESFIFSLVLLCVWSTAPVVAFIISKSQDVKIEVLKTNELDELRKIARKTYRYFEEFANAKNNFLAPDNYQEDPNRGIAYRTSPTNIGLGLLATLTARDMGYIGNIEMISALDRTMTTIEKMEMWNGHLYNWYDTRTLIPLHPRYVSTVDSGNFVCYLMTLSQGLKDYSTKPLLDKVFIEGFKDTLRSSLSEEESSPLAIECFDSLLDVDVIEPLAWLKALNAFVRDPVYGKVQQKPWKYKIERMVKAFEYELNTLMPYLVMMDQVPSCIPSERLTPSLNQNVNISDLLGNNGILLYEIDQLLEDHTFIQSDTDLAGRNWLNELRASVVASSLFASQFLGQFETLIDRIESLSNNTHFNVLYSDKRNLFSIGYSIEDNRLTNSYYDLMASEARQTSYIAIARGEVPPKHWFMLGRSLTVVDQYKGLISWSGTMFEYLMPLLIMKSYKNTLLDETYSFVVKSQKKYGKQRRMPWGSSESSFNSLDIHLDYQYKAIGVPWLGLKRGLIEDAVTAPYATFLALMVSPFDAYKNILYLKKEGLEGHYGYYEAADYTPERLEPDEKRVIVKSYMAHHQGMSLLALNNYVNQNIMQVRFSADPYVKAASLLLQEKVPLNVVFTKENKEKIMPFKDNVYRDKGSYRRFTAPHVPLPKAHVLSNGNYSVMTTDRGTGYSRNKSVAVTRWREDSILDTFGMFFYINNKQTDENWSATYAPLCVKPDSYEAVFTADKAYYKRTDETIETITEIIVTSGDNAEIRRVKLKNNGDEACTLDITSYYEIVLAPQNSDLAHPAFSNLFVETQFDHQYKALIANRRPRGPSDTGLWMAQIPVMEGEMVGDVQYETDRMQFIGRGRTVKNPMMVDRDRPLSNTVGTVLDPIFSMRIRVNIQSNQSVRISFVTMIAESKEALYELLEKYSSLETCYAAFWLAVSRSQVETRYLNIKAADMELYQNMISDILFISPLRRKHVSLIRMNQKGQSALWPYGISGDRPIILVMLNKTEEVEILYEVLKAHEYWRLKDLRIDLVILIQEENSYTNPLLSMATDIVYSNRTHDGVNRQGDTFILNANNLATDDVYLLSAVARMIFRGNGETMEQQLVTPEQVLLPEFKAQEGVFQMGQTTFEKRDLQYFNGLGGFNLEGDAYVIELDKGQVTPVPWSNVIANPDFGFIVTESGGGFTWRGNSRENKLTPWSNDPVSDTPGEIFYLRDESANLWTLTPQPIREEEPYIITHGFGYSEFEHASHGLSQKLVQFVPLVGTVKISMVSLKNTGTVARNITLTYYVTPVMGVQTSDTGMHLISSQALNGMLMVENPYNRDFANQVLFMNTSEEERWVTGDRREFFGSGGLVSPHALSRETLSGAVGAGYNPCVAMQVNVSIQPGETKELVCVLGMAKNLDKALHYGTKYITVEAARLELAAVQAFWKDKLQVIQVSTPEPSMDLMLNGWLMYQVISCRLWARSAFYQSGGAFGFRDQLQDSLSTMTLWPQLAKEQILRHAAHQFVEGDALHWWHEPTGKGTRTRISDDYLWLPFVTAEYIKETGDVGILDIQVTYLEEEVLRDYEEERYCAPRRSEETLSLYEHCINALKNGFHFGERGLPLIGGGDWNDGMNRVGHEGKGESVWLGWFLFTALQNFIPLCHTREDSENEERFNQVSVQLTEAIETNAWDGNWYKRAYFDDGKPLGSAQNTECRIDSLAQTWAVLSGAGDMDRAKRAMDSLEDYLVVREEGLIKLLTPPFNESDMEPGYIKGYVPGVRENGGQYTHAAIWVVQAFAKLGDGDKALELFEMINPINHARTHSELFTYKVEPYVLAADVYSAAPHIGRGGWTWYTGSAGWMYKAGVESILGFTKRGESLMIDPCIPIKWAAYGLTYRYMDTTYAIQVSNPAHKSKSNVKIIVDGIEVEGNVIPLVNDGITHQVEVRMVE